MTSLEAQARATETEPQPRAPQDHLRYRPHLDGLRTIAVFLVVAFHSGLGIFRGGFIGVDLFFVLSGFLVTSVLVRDLKQRGSVDKKRFYARRVRRILPAAAVTLLVTALVYRAIATPSQVQDALGGFRAAFLYVANWYFIRQSTDYFAANVNSSPVLHFWSLAVEEQFYIVWPLVMGGLFALTRNSRWRWWILRGTVVVLGIASAVLALHVASTNLDLAYYGTEMRAYQLLAGAAIALTPQLLHLSKRVTRYAAAIAALAFALVVLVATKWISVGPITRGVYVAVLVCVLIVALENATGGRLKRALSSGPMTYLGKISYGIYLWHWPLIIFITYNHSLSPVRLFVIDAIAATALAALSFKILETPIRVTPKLDRFRGPVVVIGFTTSILLGLFVMPAILNTGSGSVAVANASTSGATTLLNWRVAKNDIPNIPDCMGKSVTKCTIVHGSGPSIVLMGDSVARMWIPAFTAIAQRDNLTFSVAALQGCPWQHGLNFATSNKIATDCSRHQDDFYKRVVPELHPDIIFLAQHGYDDPTSPNQLEIPGRDGAIGIDDSDFESSLIDITSSSLRELQAPHRQIVFVEPVPSPPTGVDPLNCLSNGEAASKCGFSASTAPSPLEQFFRRTAATDPSVKSVDLDALVCPNRSNCAEIIDDIIVWRDTDHITATYARVLSPRVEAILRQQGIITAK